MDVTNSASASTPADAGVVPGSDAYNAQMAAMGSQVNLTAYDNDLNKTTESVSPAAPEETSQVPTEEPKSDRPEWLPEKFKTPEDLFKSYQELEKKLSSGNKDETKQADTESTPAENNQEDKTDQQVTSGVDIPKYQNEFASTGKLSDDSYAELEKSGLSKALVDSYIAGQLALQDSMMNQGYNVVGGKAQYEAIIKWAGTNLTPSEQAAFDKAVLSDDRDFAHLAIKGLESRYTAANGKMPTLLNGNASPVGATNGAFESREQVVAAMSDARYRNDPAYRKDVERRISMMSNF